MKRLSYAAALGSVAGIVGLFLLGLLGPEAPPQPWGSAAVEITVPNFPLYFRHERHEGATLHGALGDEWLFASQHDRIATVADLMKNYSGRPFDDALRADARRVAECITAVMRRDPQVEVQRVGVVMDICSGALGLDPGEPAEEPADESR